MALLFLILLCPLFALAQNNTTSGAFTTEPPTLLSLGFEWKITGPDNRNARIDFTYRKSGDKR